MAKFLFVYHGGKQPETEEEGARVMAAWMAWMEKHADAMVDDGAPVGLSKTVTSDGVEDNGGANPASGYTLVNADSMEDAIAIAQGCPILEDGTVEVAECMEM